MLLPLSESTTIQKLLQTAKQKLIAVTATPLLEAEILLAFALNRPRTFLHANLHEEISQEEERRFSEYLKRRVNQEPIPYILGKREFWSLELLVTKDTLIPRPETELLVETALKLLANDNHHCKNIADVGTGSGAIAIALAHERPRWQIYGTDISEEALSVAQKNAHRLGLKNVTFATGNWLDALFLFNKCREWDAIISNPPYIGENEWDAYKEQLKFEPRGALISGPDGAYALKVLVNQAKNHLNSGGYLLLEHGYSQGEMLRKTFWIQGYTEVFTFCDLSGQERVTMGKWLD